MEKIESVPSPSGQPEGEGKKREAKYVELIGSGPGTLWEAGKGKGMMLKGLEVDEGEEQEKAKESPRKGAGRFKSMVIKKGGNAAEEEEEDGWESIPEVSRVRLSRERRPN